MATFKSKKELTEIVKHRRIHVWVENLGYITVTRKALFKACVGVNCRGSYEFGDYLVRICF